MMFFFFFFFVFFFFFFFFFFEISLQPVIIRGATLDANNKFRDMISKSNLLKNGNWSLLLSTANTASYVKKRVLLGDYINGMMEPQNETVSGLDTYYQFGDQVGMLFVFFVWSKKLF
jgi:hypothetical protein